MADLAEVWKQALELRRADEPRGTGRSARQVSESCLRPWSHASGGIDKIFCGGGARVGVGRIRMALSCWNAHLEGQRRWCPMARNRRRRASLVIMKGRLFNQAGRTTLWPGPQQKPV